MSEDENQDIPMAECGACGSIIPLDSDSCPNCGAIFTGVSDEELGECGACGHLQSINALSCSNCGVSFVSDDTEVIDASEDVTTTELELQTIETMATEVEESHDDIEETTQLESVIEDEAELHSDIDSEQNIGETVSTEDYVVDDTIDIDVSADAPSDSEEEVQSVQEEIEQEELVEDEIEEDAIDEDETASVDVDDIEEEIDSLIDDLVDDETELSTDDEADVEKAEDEDDESAEDDDESTVEDEDEEDQEVLVKMAFEKLAFAIAESGLTAAEAFAEIDRSGDNLIDAPELQKGIKNIAGDSMSPKHVTAIMNHLDEDGDRRIDPQELLAALEKLRIGIQAGNMPKVKKFPTGLQKFLMGKKANDIFYPIGYFLMVCFIGAWVVNGMGLLVDGTGGTIEFTESTNEYGDVVSSGFWDICDYEGLEEKPDPCRGQVTVGETYPCDPNLDENKCANSLTPFSGKDGATSMPAGFYTDGYVMIGLGVFGLIIIAFLHLIYAPKLRAKVKKKSGTSNDEENEDSEEEEEEDELSEEDEDTEDSEDEDESDYEDEDDDDEDEDDDDEEYEDDDDDYDDDDIDVGDYIGLDIDGEEFFGEIIEFDDDEGTVTIETDDGEEVTGDQDDMFLEDDE